MPDVSVEALDAVPCGRAARWLGLIRRMGVRAVIDTLLPTASEISHGAVIEVLMLSRLLDPHPLSRIEDWLRASGVDVRPSAALRDGKRPNRAITAA